MGRERDDGPYDFAREIHEAREEADRKYGYTPEERRFGIGAPTRQEAERDAYDAGERW